MRSSDDWLDDSPHLINRSDKEEAREKGGANNVGF